MRPGDAPPSRRVLFLDDDPGRATAFLSAHPGATWVRTVPECLAELQRGWDEVHLDHDLGGETHVATDRQDCGMEVVRWLCDAPRPHLADARFVVHTHNPNAACVMILHLQESGFDAAARPFMATRPHLPRPERSGPRRWLEACMAILRPPTGPPPRTGRSSDPPPDVEVP